MNENNMITGIILLWILNQLQAPVWMLVAGILLISLKIFELILRFLRWLEKY